MEVLVPSDIENNAKAKWTYHPSEMPFSGGIWNGMECSHIMRENEKKIR